MTGVFYFGRFLRVTAVALLLLLLLANVLPNRTEAHTAQNDVLRLHIIANSDAPDDQRVKLLVRDAILANMPESNSCAEAEAYVLHNGKTLLESAEATLQANGFSYGAQLLLGTSTFPDRTYDGVLFPAGEYRALRIVLGRGAGQNFWCVLFPPLCIVTKEEQPLPALEEIEFRSSILDAITKWRDAR